MAKKPMKFSTFLNVDYKPGQPELIKQQAKKRKEQDIEEGRDLTMKQLDRKVKSGSHEVSGADPKVGRHVELRHNGTGKVTTHYIKEARHPDHGDVPGAVKHGGKTYYGTGKHGTNVKTGNPSSEYQHTSGGRDSRVWRDHKTGKVVAESVEQVDEVLSYGARRKKAVDMRKNKARIKAGQHRQKLRTASQTRLKKRSRRDVHNTLFKKYSKGKGRSEMSAGQRASIEKRIANLGSARIDRMARKLLPSVRQRDRDRRGSK